MEVRRFLHCTVLHCVLQWGTARMIVLQVCYSVAQCEWRSQTTVWIECAAENLGENESDVKSNFIWIPSSSLENTIPNIHAQIRVMCMNTLARTVCTSCNV